MATADQQDLPKYLTFSKSRVPFLGGLIDYVVTSYNYMKRAPASPPDKLHGATHRARLSPSFMFGVCLALGLVCNTKLELVLAGREPLQDDLPDLLLSARKHLYVDQLDTQLVMWCIEASDVLSVLISSLLILNSSYVPPPLSEYVFAPWLGVAARGLLLRQLPAGAALLYAGALVSGRPDLLFFTCFSMLVLLETRLWVEMARVVCARWETRECRRGADLDLETLWNNDDGHSVEVHNIVY